MAGEARHCWVCMHISGFSNKLQKTVSLVMKTLWSDFSNGVNSCVSSVFTTYWDCPALSSGFWCALFMAVDRFMECGLYSESNFWTIFVFYMEWSRARTLFTNWTVHIICTCMTECDMPNGCSFCVFVRVLCSAIPKRFMQWTLNFWTFLSDAAVAYCNANEHEGLLALNGFENS